MSLTVIVGGQFGSEGKGKICAYLSLNDDVDAVVRCGSTNSGHTVIVGDRKWELRMIPAGFINPRAILMLPAGAIIDPRILRKEIEETDLARERLIIDKKAGILETFDIDIESRMNLTRQFGSTQSGVGHAISRRVLRRADFRLAEDVEELLDYATVGDVSAKVNELLESDRKVIIEGTQGFGLSIYHTPHYPYATSRDTTAAGFLAEVGLSPRYVNDIILAFRTFPIRVGGNSGPLPNEVTWDYVRRSSGYPYPLGELTTTTKRLRRVAKFDPLFVKRAVVVNGATKLAMHGADYIDFDNKAQTKFETLSLTTKDFVSQVESETGTPVIFIGTGPANSELIDRRVDISTLKKRSSQFSSAELKDSGMKEIVASSRS